MVRKAKAEDYDLIVNLRDPYLLDRDQFDNPDYLMKKQEEGFLIRNYTRTDFLDDLNRTFYVYEINNKIVAYIRIEYKVDSDFQYNRLNVWINNDFKDIYFNEEHHSEIGSIVVHKDYRETDVPKELLQAVLDELKSQGYKYLFTSVVYAPIINTPMMMFYEDNGFEKICLTTSANMNDMENYQGLLYVKEI